MGHRASRDFFKEKRTWSKRKDLILTYYLKPYLPKVARLKRPILIVDGFAGPGKFGDGEPGSPLLICGSVQEAIRAGATVKVLCIERDPELYAELEQNISPFPWAACRNMAFLGAIPEIAEAARSHTVFMYVDPYAVDGLEWEALDRVFRHLGTGQSVEILLNFNGNAFARRCLSALALASPDPDPDAGDDGYFDAEPLESASADRLDKIVGGTWWREAVQRGGDFVGQLSDITEGYCRQLRGRFSEVCFHNIKDQPRHKVPKYSLVFGSRSRDALVLMNDAVVTARREWADQVMPLDGYLFDTRPLEISPDKTAIAPLVLWAADRPKSRDDVIAQVMRQRFGEFTETDIRRCTKQLLQEGKLKSSTGKTRINGSVDVWRVDYV